jgi:hypothetical protein
MGHPRENSLNRMCWFALMAGFSTPLDHSPSE